MKVAVAFADLHLEREVMRELRKQGHELVRRCVDLADVDQIPAGIRIYSDETFHAHHPMTFLVRSASDISHRAHRMTRLIGFFGPRGAPGVSTIALNLSVLFPSAHFIDASGAPSVLSMTGRANAWPDISIAVASDPASLDSLLQQSTSNHTFLDGGIWSEDMARYCDEIILVVAAHPISVERYQQLDIRLAHRVVFNCVDEDAISQTAIHLLKDSSVHQIPRDDRACERAFITAQPITAVAPRSGISQGLSQLAEALA